LQRLAKAVHEKRSREIRWAWPELISKKCVRRVYKLEQKVLKERRDRNLYQIGLYLNPGLNDLIALRSPPLKGGELYKMMKKRAHL